MHDKTFDVKPQTQKRGAFLVYNDMWEAKYPSMASKLVFMSLWKFANREDKQAYPSVQTLARLSECSERTVQRALKELEEVGYITRQMRKSTTLYTVNDQVFIEPSGDKLTGLEGDKLTGLKFSGDNMTPHPRQIDTPGVTEWRGMGDNMTPKHNHLTEPINMKEEHAAAAAPSQQIFELIHIVTNGRASDKAYAQIINWIEEGFEEKSIVLALEKTKAAAKDFAYTAGIIKKWMAKKLFTYEQCSTEGKQPMAKAVGEGLRHPDIDYLQLSETDRNYVDVLRTFGPDQVGLPPSKKYLLKYI